MNADLPAADGNTDSADVGMGGDAPSDLTTVGDAPMETGDASGAGTPDVCSFDITGALSPVIPTVGVIDWSTDLPGVTEARLEFSLDAPQAFELNVGGSITISVTDRHALMLGLKPGRSYTYRIVATAGQTVCVSADQALATQVDPASPSLMRADGDAASARSRGFIVTCSYNSNFAVIIDTDGAVVWRVTSPGSCTRALMDWDGNYMWMMAANASTGSVAGGVNGDVRRVLMDGSGLEKLSGLQQSHHDFAVLPGGVSAFLVVGDGGDTNVVERAADGTMHAVAQLNDALYGSTGSSYHPNALRYHAKDDSYTVSDLHLAGIVKLSRQGSLLWRVTGLSAATSSPCTDMTGTHGHQLLDNGNLLFFKANYGSASLSDPSPACEYALAGSGVSQTSTLAWSYVGDKSSLILGDVQRLPSGNTLVTYSTTGVIAEVTPAGVVVQTLTNSSFQFGYATFRPSLYGPPQ